MPPDSLISLGDLCFFVKETCDCSFANSGTYVSTESMLPNMAGITASESIPSTGLVNKYRPKDILVSNIRPYFKKIWQSDRCGTCSNDVLVIRAKDERISDYLFALLSDNRFFDHVMLGSKGTKMPRGDKSQILTYPIKKQTFSEMLVIGNFISQIKKKIACNQAINDNLLRLMELLFDHWIDKQSDRSKELSLYDFSKITYGAPFSSSLFNQNGIGYPLIRIRDLKTNSPQFFTDEQHLRLTYINPGDILIGMDAEFKPHVWIGEKGVLNQRICRLEPVDEKICPYLPLLLIRDKLEFIESYKSGTTVSHIGKEDFDQMTINSPPVSEMIEFSKTINPIYSMYISNGIEVRRLSQLRDLLLPKLMSGEIDVSTLMMPTKYSFSSANRRFDTSKKM